MNVLYSSGGGGGGGGGFYPGGGLGGGGMEVGVVLMLDNCRINNLMVWNAAGVVQTCWTASTPRLVFARREQYRFVRHPIYVAGGWSFWSAPVMTGGASGVPRVGISAYY